MQVYRLVPTEDAASPNWSGSTYHGAVIVRAMNERVARMAACITFGIGVKREAPFQDTGLCSWQDGRLVECAEMTGDEFSCDGPVEVLSPEQFENLVADVDWRSWE